MSISQHGKQQKQKNSSNTNGSSNNRKNQGLSTAAVYPIIQPKVQKTSVPEIAVDVTSRIPSIRGQCVRPNPVVEHTIVTSVAEFVSEVIPQGGAQSVSQSELIYWVKIQKCSCEYRGRTSTFVVVVGLARGYQVWMMLENGECEEVISERKGPLKVGHMLPFTTKGKDRFQDHRPLFALVDGNPMSSSSQENKFCSVSFVSLKRGKTVHTLEFDNPIVDIESSSECLLIVFNESIVICDHESLSEQHCVVVPAPEDSVLIPCYALSDSILSFAENKLNKAVQSCGGTLPEEELSYGGQVMSAAKTISKTVSSISESFVSSFGSIPQNNKNNAGEISNSGIVSVIDVNSLPQANESLNSLRHYIAHFMAHDSAIGYLAFGNGGQLLLTSTQTSTVFHLFLLHPYPTSPKLGSVQHIYTLNRGNSAAKVLQSAFSSDNRWLAISTNHGTTHLFAVAPFGGPVSSRTHCGKFVNKESKFEKTAGFTSTEQLAKHMHHSNGYINGGGVSKVLPAPLAFKDHPAVVANATMSKTVVNPRLTYYTPPIVLSSLAKIKQRMLSAENLTAWASDNTPSLLSSAASRRNHRYGNGHLFSDTSRRLAVILGTSFGDQSNSSSLCVFTMNAEGVLTEHRVDVRRERHNSSGSTSSLNLVEPLSSSPINSGIMHANMVNNKMPGQHDAPVRTKVAPTFQWILKRNKGTSGVELIEPPLPASSPLLQISSKASKRLERKKQNLGDSLWLPQVEVVTYSGPHRRLWMGPQFNFGVYSHSDHSSAQLFNPNDNSYTPYFPTSQKCCPVLIEKNPTNLGLLNCDTSLDSASRIVCGSWSSDIDFKTAFSDGTYAAVKEKIEDAMRCDVREDKIVKNRHINKHSNNSSGNSLGQTMDLMQLSGIDL